MTTSCWRCGALMQATGSLLGSARKTRRLEPSELERLVRGCTIGYPVREILEELVYRALQAKNPHPEQSPCRFDAAYDASCGYGAYGCVVDHLKDLREGREK